MLHTLFCFLGGEDMDYNLWINKAVMKIGALEKGKEFTLKNLFTGIEWDELKTGEKRSREKRFCRAEIMTQKKTQQEKISLK